MRKRECDRCKEDMPYSKDVMKFSGEVQPQLFVHINIDLAEDVDLCRTCFREIIYKDI